MSLETSGTQIVSLRRRVDETLRDVVGGASSCALIDYPNFDNVGAIAIALATHARLHAMGVRVSYACEQKTYDRHRLAAALRRHPGPLLLLGGGVFGDQYPEAQLFREKVIEDFPDDPIVQLPQSIHFRGRNGVDRARRLVESHARFTLLVREPVSLEFAQREFDADSRLCPDMSLALGPVERPTGSRGHILWLTPGDVGPAPERSSHADPNARIVDWESLPPPKVREAGAWAGWWLHRIAAGRRAPGPARAAAGRMLPGSFEKMGRRKLKRGLELLASAEVVVSDRLHGHILSLLMGIPSVLLDNSHEGVSGSFHETWTKDVPGSALAHDVDEAWEAARRIVLSEPGPRGRGADV